MKLKARGFALLMGRLPQDDELERVNCEKAGEPGHLQCGWCGVHARPRYICGCRTRIDHSTETKEEG